MREYLVVGFASNGLVGSCRLREFTSQWKIDEQKQSFIADNQVLFDIIQDHRELNLKTLLFKH
jgi:hypothetical protein